MLIFASQKFDVKYFLNWSETKFFKLFFFQENPRENLNLAFDIAERYLDIPRMLDAEGEINKLNVIRLG